MVDLDETVLGVLQLERQGGMESHMIQEWDTFQVVNDGASAVGAYRWHILTNPVGSNRIAVVDWYRRLTSRRLFVFMTRGIPPGFAVAATGDPVDSRIPNSRQPACTFQTFTTNIGTFGTAIGEVESAEQQDFKVVLGEDGTVAWRSGGHAEDMILTVRWAERDSAPFEQ